MAAQYRETHTFQVDYPTLFNSCQHAVKTAGFRLLSALPAQGVIHAEVSLSL